MSEFYQEFKIDNDISADEGIEALRELQEEVTRLERVTDARIERLMEGFKSKSLPLKERIMSLQNEPKAYFGTVKTKDTKTLRKYSLPSGVLVEKLQNPEYKRDNDLLASWAENNNVNYIKVKREVSWEAVKKDIIVVNGVAVHKETGEVIDGIEVVEREPKFEIR